MLTQWEKLKAVQRMQDFIEAHLDRPITLSELARSARYSPWHAAHVFKECTGRSPFEYIRLRRLSEAAYRLAHSPRRVIDVALEFLFDSHDGFSRAFARQFGMSPRTYRQAKPPLQPYLPPQMRDFFTARQKGEWPMSSKTSPTPIFVQVIDHPARKLIVKRGRKASHYLEYCEEVGCDVWETLGKIEGALREPMGLWLPAKLQKSGTSTYVQGVEVRADYAGPVPEGYEMMDLPACKMMVFQGPPFEDKDFSEAITSLWDCINAYKPETYGYAWADEEAPRFQLAPLGYRGYIEGRPVRAVNG